MAFKILKKRSKASLLSERTISISKGGSVRMSNDLAKHLKKFKCVIVLVDTDYNKLAFKPTNDLNNGFVLSKSKHGRTLYFIVTQFKKMGISGIFDARHTEGKIIIDSIDTKKLKNCQFTGGMEN